MLSRRRFLGCSAAAVAACHRPGWAHSGYSWKELSFDEGADCPDGEEALVLVPDGAEALPMVVAFHGRRESLESLEVGSHAWRDSYELDRLYARMRTPPLTDLDLRRMSEPTRLAAINESLANAPFRGLVTVCPYTPDVPDRKSADFATFSRFVANELVPAARRLTGRADDRDKTGIDGISMGGRIALLVGLSHPELFGRVGALQPALKPADAPAISALAKEAMAKAPVQLRLVTSDRDDFLAGTRATSARMHEDGVPHELLVLRGEHGYEFNRGPGGVEMLFWHERLGRGLPLP
jgi:iron(III)-salmochelin esterase